MTWKDLPYWIKGGVILSVIDIVLVLFTIFTTSPKEATIMGLGFIHIPLIYLIAGLSLLNLNVQPLLENVLSFAILGILSWFLIGVLIGWIYELIKNKNKK